MSLVLEGLQRQLDFSVSTHLYRAPNGRPYSFCSVSSPQSYNVVRPSSVWSSPSSSFVHSLHYSEHHCFQFPVVTHSGDMSKQANFQPCCFLPDRLFPVPSTEHCVLLFCVSISHSKLE